MKKLLIFSFFQMWIVMLFAQDVTILTQSQVDTWDSSITVISGNVKITGDFITNLDGLSGLTTIQGRLDIENANALINLDGLIGLKSVNNLLIRNNQLLENIDGLSELSDVSSYIIIEENQSLLNIDGLVGITTLNERLRIDSNASLINLDGTSAISKASNATIEISNNPSLQNLNGLMSLSSDFHSILIDNNDALENIEGLSGLTTLLGGLTIKNNDELQNIDGLRNLTDIQYLTSLSISNNAKVENIDALNGITRIIGSVGISGIGITNIDGFRNLRDIAGTLSIFEVSITEVDSLENLQELYGSLRIVRNEELVDLSGLKNLNNIIGKLSVSYNPSLTNLDGLRGLRELSGMIGIEQNPALVDIDGLSGLTEVGGGQIYFIANPSLAKCCVLLPIMMNAMVLLSGNQSSCNSSDAIITWLYKFGDNVELVSEAENFEIFVTDEDFEGEIQRWLENQGNASLNYCGTLNWTHNYDFDYSVGNHFVTFTAIADNGQSVETTALLSIQACLGQWTNNQAQELIVQCDQDGNYIDQVDQWLSSNAGLTLTSDCDEVEWTHDWEGSYDTGNYWVTFTASGATSTFEFSRGAFLSIQRGDAAPMITTEPSDLTLFSNDQALESSIASWLLSNGGAEAVDNCGIFIWSNDYVENYNPGDYLVTFTAKSDNGATSESTAILTIELVSSVEETEVNKLIIAPIPVNHMIHISSDDHISQVNIFLVSGKQVYKSEGINTSQTSLDISHLPSGVYLISVVYTDGHRLVRRIVKD